MSGPPSSPSRIPVSGAYMATLGFVMLITVLALVGAIMIAIFGSNADAARTAGDNLWKAFFSGFAAFIGLLGGKGL